MRTKQRQGASIQHDERAIFTRLIALNTLLESTRAGLPAKSFGTAAQSCHTLLTTYLDKIKAEAV